MKKVEYLLLGVLLLMPHLAMAQFIGSGQVGNRIYENGNVIGIINDDTVPVDVYLHSSVESIAQREKMKRRNMIVENVRALFPRIQAEYDKLVVLYPSVSNEIKNLKNTVADLSECLARRHPDTPEEYDKESISKMINLYDAYEKVLRKSPEAAEKAKRLINILWEYNNGQTIGSLYSIKKEIFNKTSCSSFRVFPICYQTALLSSFENYYNNTQHNLQYWISMDNYYNSLTIPPIYSWEAYLSFLGLSS